MCTSRPRVRRSCFQDQREQDSSPTSLCGLRLMAAVPQPESPSGTPIPRVHAGQAAPLRAEAHVVSFTGKEASEMEVLWKPSLVTGKK